MLDAAHRQPVTGVWVFWLVQLELGGVEGWFEYEGHSIGLGAITMNPRPD
jgi:hypothetical protein